MKKLVPINWCILRERLLTCAKCGSQKLAKNWRQDAYPHPAITCPACFYELDMLGSVKDYYRESKYFESKK